MEFSSETPSNIFLLTPVPGFYHGIINNNTMVKPGHRGQKKNVRWCHYYKKNQGSEVDVNIVNLIKTVR